MPDTRHALRLAEPWGHHARTTSSFTVRLFHVVEGSLPAWCGWWCSKGRTFHVDTEAQARALAEAMVTARLCQAAAYWTPGPVVTTCTLRRRGWGKPGTVRRGA